MYQLADLSRRTIYSDRRDYGHSANPIPSPHVDVIPEGWVPPVATVRAETPTTTFRIATIRPAAPAVICTRWDVALTEAELTAVEAVIRGTDTSTIVIHPRGCCCGDRRCPYDCGRESAQQRVYDEDRPAWLAGGFGDGEWLAPCVPFVPQAAPDCVQMIDYATGRVISLARDEYAALPQAELADDDAEFRVIVDHLIQAGWTAGEIDDWRHCLNPAPPSPGGAEGREPCDTYST